MRKRYIKQEISATYTAPSGGYSFNIISIHRIDSRLIAVSEAKKPSTQGHSVTMAMVDISDTVYLKFN